MLHFTLNNGQQIPAIGFGTYKASQEAMTLSFQAGYRYFDTAAFYGNESLLGRVISQSRTARNEIFIASKVWKADLGYQSTIESLNRTLENLGTSYVDIYMIHWPRPDLERKDWKELDLETWRAMEDSYRQGKIRALGLSNFLPYHAENIIKNWLRSWSFMLDIHRLLRWSITVHRIFCFRLGVLPDAGESLMTF